MLMPAGLYALEGVTGLRQLLFSETRIEAIYSFENAFERFFPGVDSRTKFLTLVFEKRQFSNQSFPAAFMLRNEGFLALPLKEREARSVRISSDLLMLTNPTQLSIIELRDDKERKFVERIYRAVPPLSKKFDSPESWNVEIHRELHSGDDAWRFRKRDWLVERGCHQQGCAFLAPPMDWFRERPAEYVPGIRYIPPEGPKFRVTSIKPLDESKKRAAGGSECSPFLGF